MNAPRICIVYDRTGEPLAQTLSHNLQSHGIVHLISSASSTLQVGNYQWFIFVRTPTAVQSHTLDTWVKSVLERFDAGQIQGVLAVATGASESEDIPPLWSTIRTYSVGTSEQDWQRALDKIVKTLSYSRGPSETPIPQRAGNPMGGRTRLRRRIIPALVCVLLIGSILTLFWNSQRLISATTNHGKSTPTVHASPTINITATSIAEIKQYQKLYNDSVKGKPVLTLASTATDKTPLWDSSDQCMLQGGSSYIAKASVTNPLQLCMATKTHLGKSFAYQATLSINSAGYAGGLVFRSSGDPAKPYYRFAFIQGQVYNLVLTNQPGGDDIVKLDTTAQLTPTTLTVIVYNSIIYLYIDKQYVYQTPDTLGAKSDQVGVYAASQAGAETDVTFSDVQAWTLA